MSFKFLMCPPDYYEIAYEINPWMSLRRNINTSLARTQWDLLYKLLTDQIGVQVELINPVKGLPDMVFTASAGMVWNHAFIRSNFRHKQRQPEAAFFESWFQEHHYDVITLPKVLYFEGESDAFVAGDYLFCGYHFRSDIQAHHLVAEIVQKTMISMALTDERFYHLDTCFCPISDKTALYYGKGFNESDEHNLRKQIPNSILVRIDEALQFICNSIVVGNKIITPAKCPQTIEMLRFLGYHVYPVDLSEFIKAGGNAKCLVLTLDRNGTN